MSVLHQNPLGLKHMFSAPGAVVDQREKENVEKTKDSSQDLTKAAFSKRNSHAHPNKKSSAVFILNHGLLKP